MTKLPRKYNAAFLADIRRYAMFAICFFIATSILAIIFVLPVINKTLSDQHVEEVQIELGLEQELFERFIENKRSVLQDLAEFPSIANAVMLSDVNQSDIFDFFENVVIDGKKGQLILQDIDGNILIQTANNRPSIDSGLRQWQNDILDQKEPVAFQLISQDGDSFKYQVSVPVLYNSYPEGILSAIITSKLDEAFITHAFKNNVGFRVQQGPITIQTGLESIEIPQEYSVKIGYPEINFVYVSDVGFLQEKQRELRNRVFLILLAGLATSFLILTFVAYRTALQDDERVALNRLSLKAYTLPLLISTIGVTASVSAFVFTTNLQNMLLQNSIKTENASVIEAITKKIDISLSALDSINALFDASSRVNRNEFEKFVSPLLSNNENIRFLAWAPIVPQIERVDLESEVIAEGFPDFTVFEVESDLRSVPAKFRDVYFPLVFVEPFSVGKGAIGLDIGSNKPLSNTLSAAVKTQESTASSPVRLNRNSTRHSAVFVFKPIYSKKNDNVATESLEGFSVLFLRASDLLNVKSDFPESMSIHVEDISDPENVISIFGNALSTEKNTHQGVIDVASRSWRITTARSNVAVPYRWLPSISLITGLLLTALVTAGLINLIRRREVVENLVKQRTIELSKMVDNLADSNEELTRFAFVCSHDLQEPLRMIRSFSERLETHLGDSLENDERGKKYFRFVIDGAARAQNLIADILAYSSIGTDTQRFTAVDGDKLIVAIKDNMRTSLEESGGSITHDAFPELHGSKTQLLQLFQNLINNGLKYHDSETAPHVHVSLLERKEFWQFSVKDNGIGMEDKHLKKIFDVFQRLNRQSQFAGTGIGLSICKKIVERHNGKIWVESVRGAGSTFHFTIKKPTGLGKQHD